MILLPLTGGCKDGCQMLPSSVLWWAVTEFSWDGTQTALSNKCEFKSTWNMTQLPFWDALEVQFPTAQPPSNTLQCFLLSELAGFDPYKHQHGSNKHCVILSQKENKQTNPNRYKIISFTLLLIYIYILPVLMKVLLAVLTLCHIVVVKYSNTEVWVLFTNWNLQEEAKKVNFPRYTISDFA